MNELDIYAADAEARAWVDRYEERQQGFLLDHQAAVTARAIAREQMLDHARARRMDEAHAARTSLELVILIRPVPAELEPLLAPFDDAAIAYLDHLDGDRARAEERVTRAIEVHGQVARDFDFPARHGNQIHLTVNLARCLVADRRASRAEELLDALEASDGDPSSWPFAGGPHDPWYGLPPSVRASLHRQVERARLQIGLASAV